jgi:fatty-acyl-CoA synthase
MLLSAPEAESTQLDGWKVIIGGSALTKGLVIAAAQKGISAFTAYGMSETCPVVSSSNMTDINDHQDDDIALEARCKTGVPAVMVDLRVVDADMNDIPTGGEVTGEVVVRAPWLTQGYTGSPEKSEELWQGGYLHTGDVGYIDDTGSLRITDRIKDVIKSGGEWISSIQLEDIVSRCEGVAEVAAFGIPDERWGERPMLVVVKSTEDLNADTIKTAISEEVDSGVLSRWAIPERIEFVDAIPKTSVGKLDKKVMRKTYG